MMLMLMVLKVLNEYRDRSAGPYWALVDSRQGDRQLTKPSQKRHSLRTGEEKRYSYSRTGILTSKFLGSRVSHNSFFFSFYYLAQFLPLRFDWRFCALQRAASQFCGKMANTAFPVHHLDVMKLSADAPVVLESWTRPSVSMCLHASDSCCPSQNSDFQGAFLEEQ